MVDFKLLLFRGAVEHEIMTSAYARMVTAGLLALPG